MCYMCYMSHFLYVFFTTLVTCVLHVWKLLSTNSGVFPYEITLMIRPILSRVFLVIRSKGLQFMMKTCLMISYIEYQYNSQCTAPLSHLYQVKTSNIGINGNPDNQFQKYWKKWPQAFWKPPSPHNQCWESINWARKVTYIKNFEFQ